MRAVIEAAIAGRQMIEFTYQNELRKIEPYRIGMSTAGTEVFRAFQRSNQSQPHLKPDWTTFKLAEVKDVRATATTFVIHPDYKRGDKGMKTVYREV